VLKTNEIKRNGEGRRLTYWEERDRGLAGVVGAYGGRVKGQEVVQGGSKNRIREKRLIEREGNAPETRKLGPK